MRRLSHHGDSWPGPLPRVGCADHETHPSRRRACLRRRRFALDRRRLQRRRRALRDRDSHAARRSAERRRDRELPIPARDVGRRDRRDGLQGLRLGRGLHDDRRARGRLRARPAVRRHGHELGDAACPRRRAEGRAGEHSLGRSDRHRDRRIRRREPHLRRDALARLVSRGRDRRDDGHDSERKASRRGPRRHDGRDLRDPESDQRPLHRDRDRERRRTHGLRGHRRAHLQVGGTARRHAVARRSRGSLGRDDDDALLRARGRGRTGPRDRLHGGRPGLSHQFPRHPLRL